MSLPARFDHDLCNKLNAAIPAYKWKVQYRIGGGSREAVDVGGVPKKPATRSRTVLIEAELRREDPASNILKVWNRFLHRAYPRGVVLVQGFSKVYRSRKYHNRTVKCKVARRLGKFVTTREFRYIPINIPYYPRAGSNEGDGARRKWAIWFGGQIAVLYRKNLFNRR